MKKSWTPPAPGSKAPPTARSRRLAALVFGVSLLLVIYTAWLLDARHQEQMRLAAVSLNAQAEQLVQHRLYQYQLGLRALRGAWLAGGVDDIQTAPLERYSLSRDMVQEFPGAHGFGVIRRVAEQDAPAFTTAMRRFADDQFHIRQLTPRSGDRYVIEYIAPIERNRSALGLDIASESNRRAAAEAAARSAMPTLTGPITLVQESGKPGQSVLFLLPVYASAVAPATVPARLASTVGWAYAPLLIEEVLGRDLAGDGARLELADVTDPSHPVPFYSTVAHGELAPGLATATSQRSVFGRTWRFTTTLSSHHAGQTEHRAGVAVIIPGVILSAVLAALALAASESRERARQLSMARAELAGIVESSSDAFVGHTLAGIVSSWNHGAEVLFGYPAAEAIGRRLSELSVPADLGHEDQQMLQQIGTGSAVVYVETVRRRKDGSLFQAAVSAAPLRDAHGVVVGVSSAVRDITQQKAAEARILSLNGNLEELVGQRTAELEQARRNLRTVIDAVPAMIGYWDHALVNLVANRAYEERFGLAAGALPGHNLRQLLSPEELAANHPYIEQVLAGQPQTFERDIRKRDGRLYHGLTHLAPDIEDGQVRGFFAIVHDVTELSEKRSQLAVALQENRVLLNAIDEQLLFSTTDTAGIITSVNRNFCLAHGYQPEELIGKSHSVLRSGQHDAAFYGQLWARLREGMAWRGEICNRTRDGRLCWFDTVIAPARNSAGVVQGYAALRIDISARKHADAEVTRLNDLLNNVLQAASEMSVIATDRQGMITVFNSGAERMLGYTALEMVGQNTPAMIHQAEEVAQRGRELSAEYGVPIEGFQSIVHVPQQVGPETRHWTYVRKDGSELTVSLTVTAMRNREGGLVGFLGIATDVTCQLRQQRELAASRDQLALAADVAKLGVWSMDMATRNLQWNRHMFDLYGEPAAIAGAGLGYEHWRELVHPDDVARVEAQLQATVAGGAEFNSVFRVCHRDGAVKFIQAAAQAERDQTGSAVRLTGINVDISERTAYEASLFEAKRLAEQTSVAKGQFLANMSHEIRTPLNATLGLLELLRRSPLSARQEEYAAQAQMAAHSLLGLLNDILDYSKIEADKLQLDSHPFELDELMRDLGVVLAPNLGRKDLELIFDIDTRLPRVVSGDRLRLQQVLINLAGNAIKFTPSGQVVVGLAYRRMEAGEVTVRVSISDSGIGITQEQAHRIFAAFSQAEASTTRRYGGTGLGLAICRRLVNAMGGELQLRSEPGLGSEFSFDLRLPVTDPAPPDAQAIHACLGRPLRVMVVEDHPVAGQVLYATASAFGWDVHKVASGEDAVAAIAAGGASRYDLILMDWRLPGIDGLLAASHIAALPQAAPPSVVMMATAHERELLCEPDAPIKPALSGILVKPATPLQILAVCGAAIGMDGAATGGPLAPLARTRTLDGIRVLLVEDNGVNRLVASELLAGVGAEVLIAQGGEQGVHMAIAPDAAIDVVLMDVQMPDIDGLEATRRIHADPRGAQLAVIAMTANASRMDREECLAAGMCEHIGKPFVIGDVVEAILAVTSGQQRNSAAAPDAPRAAPPDGEPGVMELLDSWPVIMGRFNHDQVIYGHALRSFDAECRRLLGLLRAGSEAGLDGAACRHLHNLKGMAATLGASALARHAARLEVGIKTGTQVVLGGESVDRLEQLATTCRDGLGVLLEQAAGRQPAIAPTQLPQSDWQAQLAGLLPLLESSDMQVIIEVEALVAQAPAADTAWSAALYAAIVELRFEDAIMLIRQCLADTSGGG